MLMNIPVVYEDDWLLVVDKPSGLLVIPTPRNEKRTLTSILNDDLKARGINYRVHPVHRLDRETSGLIIYAKGKAAQRKFMDLFKDRKIEKNYLAFVQGRLPKKEGQINYPLEGKSALTKYRILQERENFSVVEVTPLTGRTNQIRLHFKQIAHPLVGETRFAFRKDSPLKAKRLCLHAQYLSFAHPLLHKVISLRSEMPADLVLFLERNK